MATTVNVMLFMQAVLYDVTHPSNHGCEQHVDGDSCAAEPSPLNAAQSLCLWHVGEDGSQACEARPVPSDAKFILFLAVIAAIMSGPITILLDWIIMDVISARTLDETNGGNGPDQSLLKDGRVTKGSVALMQSLVKKDYSDLTDALKAYRATLKQCQLSEFDGTLILVFIGVLTITYCCICY